MQKGPERRLPRLRAELLIRRGDFNRPTPGFELNFLRHRLVSRGLVVFLLEFDHSQRVASFSTVSIRRRDIGGPSEKFGR